MNVDTDAVQYLSMVGVAVSTQREMQESIQRLEEEKKALEGAVTALEKLAVDRERLYSLQLSERSLLIRALAVALKESRDKGKAGYRVETSAVRTGDSYAQASRRGKGGGLDGEHTDSEYTVRYSEPGATLASSGRNIVSDIPHYC